MIVLSDVLEWDKGGIAVLGKIKVGEHAASFQFPFAHLDGKLVKATTQTAA